MLVNMYEYAPDIANIYSVLFEQTIIYKYMVIKRILAVKNITFLTKFHSKM
jgi:hypothetical protein